MFKIFHFVRLADEFVSYTDDLVHNVGAMTVLNTVIVIETFSQPTFEYFVVLRIHLSYVFMRLKFDSHRISRPSTGQFTTTYLRALHALRTFDYSRPCTISARFVVIVCFFPVSNRNERIRITSIRSVRP